MADPPDDPDRYDEAIRAFRRRVPLPDPLFRELDAAEKQRAFWVAGVTQARVVQEVMDAVERAVRDGTTLEAFKEEVGAQLEESWGGESPARVENVFRTNVMGAYNSGRTEIFTDPLVLEARPFWRFDAVGDYATLQSNCVCAELDGTVLPADDPFWRTHTPPLHHNCRCILTALDPEEAEDEGVSRKAPDVESSPEGFGRPADAEKWEPDLSGFSPPLRRILKDRLG
jgi:SPP1 gp7 family putative phage head morphogenesis protein